jgi:N6-L-threonylcarbamoyladenine synthase
MAKSLLALERTGLDQLVVAGGVGANRQLRSALDAAANRLGFAVFYPEPALCTDNGAMIAFAGCLRLGAMAQVADSQSYAFTVRPRWNLEDIGTGSSFD